MFPDLTAIFFNFSYKLLHGHAGRAVSGPMCIEPKPEINLTQHSFFLAPRWRFIHRSHFAGFTFSTPIEIRNFPFMYSFISLVYVGHA